MPAFIVTGQMATSFAVSVLKSTRPIVVIVAFGAQRFRSSVRLLLTRPSSPDVQRWRGPFYPSVQHQTQLPPVSPGSESRHPMLNKENYVPWSSCLLRYAKSDGERDFNVNETFHEQTDDELSERELKQIEADNQAIQTILLGLPKEIYAAVDSCETA
nr:hypothetical protein [Tanacetum cinerariifolium]